MAQEMEFFMYGVIFVVVWVILAVLGCVCWSIWSIAVGPTPTPPVDRSKWKFKYTEMAPPVRSVLRVHRTDDGKQ
jgi:hypothetical protein